CPRSRLDWPGPARSPFELSAQFLDSTRRAVPSVAHGGLVGDASAFAATEKPNVVIGIPSIEDARRVVTFATQEHKVPPPVVGFPPVAGDRLPDGVHRFAAR